MAENDPPGGDRPSGGKPKYQKKLDPYPDLSSETPDSDDGHRILIWLSILGIVVFFIAIYFLGKLGTYLTPGAHSNTLFGH